MSEEILKANEGIYLSGKPADYVAVLEELRDKPAHTVLAQAGDWHEWYGNDYKTHRPQGLVDVILRNGARIYGAPADTLSWKHINRGGDIVGYRPFVEAPAETAEETQKPTNPKDTVGIKKAPMSTVSAAVMAEVGVAMMEGALKYGRHNYRGVGVRASVYYDATIRHLFSWWEGEDVDPDSGMSHITKAIASLTVLRDAMIQNKVDDDRPPRSEGFYPELNERAAKLIERYGHVNPHHYTLKDDV